MFILMATFQSEWGLRVGREKAKKKKKKKGSSFLAINCVFLIKKKKKRSPQIGEPTLGKKGGNHDTLRESASGLSSRKLMG